MKSTNEILKGIPERDRMFSPRMITWSSEVETYGDPEEIEEIIRDIVQDDFRIEDEDEQRIIDCLWMAGQTIELTYTVTDSDKQSGTSTLEVEIGYPRDIISLNFAAEKEVK